MTDCSKCGDCCEDITLNVDRSVLIHNIATGKYVGEVHKDAVFILNNMLPTGKVIRQGSKVKRVLECAKFDKETRTCTAHNDRPKLCRDYPWYNGDPKKGDTTMKGRCSYLKDAYSMLPIIQINGVNT